MSQLYKVQQELVRKVIPIVVKILNKEIAKNIINTVDVIEDIEFDKN